MASNTNPDVTRTIVSGDIVFVPDVVDPTTGTVILSDPDPTDNCFTDNFSVSDFPAGIVGLFPCH